MSGTYSLYSTTASTRRHLHSLLLSGHSHSPSCQQRQLSFLINSALRPRVRILSCSNKSSSEQQQPPFCQPAVCQRNIETVTRRSRDQPYGQRTTFATLALSSSKPCRLSRYQCARYSTTARSNTSLGNNSDTNNGDAGATGDAYPYPYPYSDPDFLDFEHCKNPVQLEKSVASYLKSHPEPTEQALVTMLTACANLCRTTGTRSHSKATHSRKQQQPPQPPKSRRKTDINKTTATATTNSLASNLLETILQSSVFSSDQVFAIARSIHDNLSTRPHPVSGIIQDKSRQRKLSLQVTNAFLSVCAITGHFDDAWRVLQEMVDSPQGDVKPDLTTYRHVLRAAAVLRRQLTADAAASQEDQARRISSIDTTAQQVVEQAAEALSKKARMAFWIKLGLGGLTGATVCKFTMMAIMALPTSGFMGTGIDRGGSGGGSGEWGGVQSSISAYSGGSVELVKESTPSHMIDSLQSTEGIMEFLATQEVATGIGLAVGMLTAGYFILGSTRRPPMVRQATNVQEPAGDVKEEDPGFKTRHTRHQQHQHHQYHHYHLSETLPRARLFGLYFPDLATTSRDEIRDYLRKSTQS